MKYLETMNTYQFNPLNILLALLGCLLNFIHFWLGLLSASGSHGLWLMRRGRIVHGCILNVIGSGVLHFSFRHLELRLRIQAKV
jgi:hypothetical protein